MMWRVSRLAEGMSQQANSTADSIRPARKYTLRESRSSFAITRTALTRFAWARAFASSGRSALLPDSTSV